MPTVEEHEKTVATAQAALDKAKQDAADEAEANARPRPAGSVALDLLRWLVGRAGNHPVAEKLIKELETATGVTYDPETGKTSPITASNAPASDAPKE